MIQHHPDRTFANLRANLFVVLFIAAPSTQELEPPAIPGAVHTPEFAFVGHKLSDQARLYENWILDSSEAYMFSQRSAAWQFLNSALIWKTASSSSDRLYSRADILDFVIGDFEAFSDNHKTSTPGFDNPPSDVSPNGNIDDNLVVYAGAHRFGVVEYDSSDGLSQHGLSIGYWQTALGIAEKIGFNDAIRAASFKAGNVLDWMIAAHRKRIVGRINDAPRANPGGDTDYVFKLWSNNTMNSSGGNVAQLPQGYADIPAQNGNAPTWDVYQASWGISSRDGQAMDQLIAGPSVLKMQLRLSGSDIDAAQATATS